MNVYVKSKAEGIESTNQPVASPEGKTCLPKHWRRKREERRGEERERLDRRERSKK